MLCKYCGKERPFEEFSICLVKSGKTYRRKRCGLCKQKLQKTRKRNLKLWLDDIKKDLKCDSCGYNDFRALVFHHINQEEKDTEICNAVGKGWSKTHILGEISKCKILCSNCHLILHYKERYEESGNW